MIQGIIDLHYHSGPDVKPRKLNDLELMEQGVAIGARGVVIKTHFSPTAGRAALVNQIRREKYPEYLIVGMTLSQQKQLVRNYGVFLEREYAQPVGSRFVSNLESNAEAIQSIGAEHIILASDSGQVNTPI